VERRHCSCAGAARSRGPPLTRLLLDTTFLVDADRTRAELEDLIADDDDVAISPITIAELEVGVELSAGRSRQKRAQFLADVRAAIPAIPYDSEVASAHALLLAAVRRQGRPRGAHDLIIAATAQATGRTVVTSDDSAFEELPGVSVQGHR
jgi:tRNA(fMet)-specific endonuclease VapC